MGRKIISFNVYQCVRLSFTNSVGFGAVEACAVNLENLWSKAGECRFCHLYKCINCVFAWAVCKLSCGCHSFTVLNGKGWYFSLQAPTHPVSKDRQQAHFLSLFLSLLMWPTFNGKSQRSVVLKTFSVAMQTLTIALASSLSLSLSAVVSPSHLLLPERRGQ